MGVQVLRGVHGTGMTNFWSILGDGVLEPSQVNVLTRGGEPIEGMYAHTPANAAKRSFYAPWQMPWGRCGVGARVFLWFESD